MTLQRTSQHFCTFNAGVYAVDLDFGKRGLRGASAFSELVLARPLQFADDAHGLSHRYGAALDRQHEWVMHSKLALEACLNKEAMSAIAGEHEPSGL